MEGLIASANGSISSLYGCIGYNLQEMIVNTFGDGFFKYVSMTTELATRNVRRQFGANSSTEIVKRRKPELIIQPTFASMDENGPLQGIPLTTNFNHNIQYGTEKRYLLEVLRDVENGYALKFRLNRDRIDYDVTINLDTPDQQINVYKVLQNRFTWLASIGCQYALESIIPKRLIWMMSKLSNMDLNDSMGYVPMLLRRFNAHSGYPIEYKIRNASSTDEWFMYYTHLVILTFDNLSLEGGSKKGMSDDRYPITFRVTAEFNLPGVYFLESLRNMSQGMDISLVVKGYGAENDEMFPLYSVMNLPQRFPQEKNGMLLYGSSVFKTDPPKDKSHPMTQDQISLQGVLDDDHIRVLRMYRAWNMNPDALINIYVLKNRADLVYRKDFDINWDQLNLVILNPDETATYRVAIYFNYQTVNELLNNSEYKNVYDVDKVTPTKIADGLQDGSYMAIQGTPASKPIDIPHEPSEGFSPEINPKYVIMKDRVFINNPDSPIAQESEYLRPEKRWESGKAAVVDHGSLMQVNDPEKDRGSKARHNEMYSFDKNSGADDAASIHNSAVIDANLKSQLLDESGGVRNHHKIYVSSAD